jgi:pyridoxal phosphate enzyme (YggS family)
VSVAENLASLREQIAECATHAGRDPGDVSLVVVTKEVDVDRVREAIDAGVRDFGENRAQELLPKARELGARLGVQWHFIGRLQRNKVSSLAPYVTLWHSIDRVELGESVATHAPNARVLVQVNVGAEPQKGGCAPDQMPRVVDELQQRGLQVEGLMTVPPAGIDPRPCFAELRNLAEAQGLRTLSMGMSGDFEQAIEEGATIVRIGSAVFGPRPGATGLRR